MSFYVLYLLLYFAAHQKMVWCFFIFILLYLDELQKKNTLVKFVFNGLYFAAQQKCTTLKIVCVFYVLIFMA